MLWLTAVALAGAMAQGWEPPRYRAIVLLAPTHPLGSRGSIECARGGWFGGYRHRCDVTAKRATVWRMDGTERNLHPAGQFSSVVQGTDGSSFVGFVEPTRHGSDTATWWRPPDFLPSFLRPSEGFQSSTARGVSSEVVAGNV